MGEPPMLPLFAITYTAARLGLEAQSAAAFRLLRLGAGITKSADQIVPESKVGHLFQLRPRLPGIQLI